MLGSNRVSHSSSHIPFLKYFKLLEKTREARGNEDGLPKLGRELYTLQEAGIEVEKRGRVGKRNGKRPLDVLMTKLKP